MTAATIASRLLVPLQVAVGSSVPAGQDRLRVVGRDLTDPTRVLLGALGVAGGIHSRPP